MSVQLFTNLISLYANFHLHIKSYRHKYIDCVLSCQYQSSLSISVTNLCVLIRDLSTVLSSLSF